MFSGLTVAAHGVGAVCGKARFMRILFLPRDTQPNTNQRILRPSLIAFTCPRRVEKREVLSLEIGRQARHWLCSLGGLGKQILSEGQELMSSAGPL